MRSSFDRSSFVYGEKKDTDHIIVTTSSTNQTLCNVAVKLSGCHEEATGEIIPIYLKNLITAAGYARYTALKSVDDRLIASLEQFAKEQMLLFSETSFETFHVYHRNPEKFRIVPGHIELLKEAAGNLPEDSKVFLKLYRKNLGKNCHRYDKPSVQPKENVELSSNIANNAQPDAQPSLNGLGECSSRGSEIAAEAAGIVKKIMRWADSKQIKLNHDPEVIIVGPRQSKVKCCVCSKFVTLSTRNNKNGSCGWIISNYTHHLTEHERPKLTATINDFFGRAKKSNLTNYKEPESKHGMDVDRSRDRNEERKTKFGEEWEDAEVEVNTEVDTLSSQDESEIKAEEKVYIQPDNMDSLEDDGHTEGHTHYNSQDIIVYDPQTDEERMEET